MNPFAAPAPAFDEPLEMLAACHERIEAQLRTLEKLVEHVRANGADRAAGEAASHVLRYFDTAGVEHHRDEDEEIFPLLRRLAAERGRPEVSGAIDGLQREHATMGEQWAHLREALQALAAGREARLAAREVAAFAALYRRHMAEEATRVLPFAREAIGASDRAEIGRRMARRRIRA